MISGCSAVDWFMVGFWLAAGVSAFALVGLVALAILGGMIKNFKAG